MKTSLKMLLAAGLLSGAAALTTGATPASAATTHFSFSIGNMGMAYSDGYYDRYRRWHAWRNPREREWYRAHYSRNFRNMRRDEDRDGIPNRFDRDRDNDGVPNQFDRRPNNPYVR
jgi:hypothetical protein